MLYVGLNFVCVCYCCCSHTIFTSRQTQLSPGDSTESAERDPQESDTIPSSYYSDYFSYNSESVSATGSHSWSQSQGSLNLDVDGNHKDGTEHPISGARVAESSAARLPEEPMSSAQLSTLDIGDRVESNPRGA